MKNPFRLLRPLFLIIHFSFFIIHYSSAQIDSVVVTGRIRHLTARLYRESPTVLVSRNNVLQASRELVRPAPLNVDGTFRVALPLIYQQEEMYFNYGRISTAFLGSAGTISVELDADSLFTAAVPFQFGGVNAQVNNQFARYKAVEAAQPDNPDLKKVTRTASEQSITGAYNLLFSTSQATLEKFGQKEKLFPLTTRWITSVNRYNAAAFVYDKAAAEQTKLPEDLDESLRPANDLLLSAARASAMNRFANYAIARALTTTSSNTRTNGLTVRALAIMLERYGKNLTADERIRLNDYALQNTARASDLRFFDGLVKRNPDTLQRLVNVETLIQRSIQQFDSTEVDYIAAYNVASSLPGLTLDFARLLYGYARPQLSNPALGQSLDELYRLEIKDSVRIRAATQTLRKASARVSSLEISPGVFVTRDALGSGSTLFDQVVNTNRGKVIYVLLTNPTDEAGRQAALDAQRLRSSYRSRDFALVYLPLLDTDKGFWPELAARYNLVGDHLFLTNSQLMDAVAKLRPNEELSATVIDRSGKIVKRNAPLPGAFEEVRKVIDKSL